jgi:hypothetical protein
VLTRGLTWDRVRGDSIPVDGPVERLPESTDEDSRKIGYFDLKVSVFVARLRVV